MAVNVSASGKGGISLGGRLDLSQVTSAGSPAVWSAGLLLVLLAVIVLVALSLR